MLTKIGFLQTIKYIQDECAKSEKLSKGLQDYAEDKDFTGFHKSTLVVEKLLAEEMCDGGGTISWWLYNTDSGKRRDMCKITQGEPGDTDYKEWTIYTPEALYDYLLECYTERITRDIEKDPDNIALRVGRMAQTEGVKFALNEICKVSTINGNTQNDGWEERQALLKYLFTHIANSYVATTGLALNSEFKDQDISLFWAEDKEESNE